MGESKRRVVFQHYHLLLSRGAKKEKKDARILLLFYQRAIVICCLPEDIDPIVPTDLIVLRGTHQGADCRTVAAQKSEADRAEGHLSHRRYPGADQAH